MGVFCAPPTWKKQARHVFPPSFGLIGVSLLTIEQVNFLLSISFHLTRRMWIWEVTQCGMSQFYIVTDSIRVEVKSFVMVQPTSKSFLSLQLHQVSCFLWSYGCQHSWCWYHSRSCRTIPNISGIERLHDHLFRTRRSHPFTHNWHAWSSSF